MKIKGVKLKIVITAVILLFAVVLYFSPVSCLILPFTGVRCPGCGMTRALLSALRLDFKAAFNYHAMFWSVPILYLFFLFDGKIFKVKWVNVVVLILILAGFAINWVINLI